MLRKQGYRFEARPNGEQLRHLRRFAGACRFVYNKALALNKERYEEKEKHLGYARTCALLPSWKTEFAWLSDVPAQALQQSLKDLERGFTNFFEKRADFPDFHKKGRKDSFRIPQGFQLDNQNGRIKLPKIGWIRYRKSREIAGTPKNVTVTLVNGKAFISIQTEREVETPMHPSNSSVGLDWGIKRFYTLSNGKYREQLSPLQQFAVKVAKAQRVLSRKKKFSKNWKKAKIKVSKLHNQIANIRKDFVHKSSNDLSKNHAVVFIEDLSIRNMSKSARGSQQKHGKNVKQKSGLNRAVLDASPFELRRQLQYKLTWRSGLLVAVPPQNTSRRCPACGKVSAENRKTQERFSCVECGFTANADFVAAVNIKEAGLALLACSQSSAEVRPSWQAPTEGIRACA
jgi:putative transposase